jgi:HPt (histidine-containing phosphotransfer) domain-containing protein
MDDYLCKPFTLDTLRHLIHGFLGGGGRTASSATCATAPDQQPSVAERSTEANEAAIDYDALQRISALSGGSSGDLLSRVVRSYLDAAPPIFDVLRLAVEGHDSDAIRAAAHRLKGSSAQLGVEGVSRLCAELEVASRESGGTEDTETAPAALLRELEEEFGRARAALEEECLRMAS